MWGIMKKYLCSLLLISLADITSAHAAEDCTAIGNTVAAEQGGKLTKATPVVRNGKDMCVIVVLIPGRNGEKPRRVEVAVSAN